MISEGKMTLSVLVNCLIIFQIKALNSTEHNHAKAEARQSIISCGLSPNIHINVKDGENVISAHPNWINMVVYLFVCDCFA